jgi:hypothetical protein
MANIIKAPSMRKLICFPIVLLIGLSCRGQEVEFCGSFNTSNEQRFQNGFGVGIQYQHDIGQKWKIGLGVHLNFKKAQFTDEKYIDAIPFPPSVESLNSNSQRYSIRLNIQRLLIDNANVSLSLGPEISYNYFKGKDNISLFLGGATAWTNYSQTNGLTKEIGFGLISKIEIKNFLDPQLSLCFTSRPEFTTDGIFAKGYDPVFSGVLSFMEFQIGLKYRFKK